MQKHYTRCLRCGRKLKSEQAQIKGYGDICYKKLQYNHTQNLFNVGDKNGRE